MINPNSWNGKETRFMASIRRECWVSAVIYLKEGYNNGNDANDVKFLDQRELEGFEAALVPPEIGPLLSAERIRKCR